MGKFIDKIFNKTSEIETVKSANKIKRKVFTGNAVIEAEQKGEIGKIRGKSWAIVKNYMGGHMVVIELESGLPIIACGSFEQFENRIQDIPDRQIEKILNESKELIEKLGYTLPLNKI